MFLAVTLDCRKLNRYLNSCKDSLHLLTIKTLMTLSFFILCYVDWLSCLRFIPRHYHFILKLGEYKLAETGCSNCCCYVICLANPWASKDRAENLIKICRFREEKKKPQPTSVFNIGVVMMLGCFPEV